MQSSIFTIALLDFLLRVSSYNLSLFHFLIEEIVLLLEQSLNLIDKMILVDRILWFPILIVLRLIQGLIIEIYRISALIIKQILTF